MRKTGAAEHTTAAEYGFAEREIVSAEGTRDAWRLVPLPWRDATLEAARLFRRDVAKVPPHGLLLGEDGTLVVLPIGSDAVDVTRLDP